MATKQLTLLSVVVPVYNESVGLRSFHADLLEVVQLVSDDSYEIIYCDDGSTDDTAQIVAEWHKRNPRVKLISFSRNFGKESALTAGLASASGQATLMVDGDGQHPVKEIPKFMEAWKQGAQVVVGVRSSNQNEGLFKKLGSRLFYKLFNKTTGQQLLPGSTDFRLLDSVVRRAFLSLTESDRITRGLIDWLGFKRALVNFDAVARMDGQAGYGKRQLVKLALNSFVSLSPKPLYWFGYLGLLITVGAFLLGAAVFIEQLLLGDPWHWKFTGTAMLGILILFMVGIVLLAQGMLSLYISHIHAQTKGRPLYVIDYGRSAGIARSDEA